MVLIEGAEGWRENWVTSLRQWCAHISISKWQPWGQHRTPPIVTSAGIEVRKELKNRFQDLFGVTYTRGSEEGAGSARMHCAHTRRWRKVGGGGYKRLWHRLISLFRKILQLAAFIGIPSTNSQQTLTSPTTSRNTSRRVVVAFRRQCCLIAR